MCHHRLLIADHRNRIGARCAAFRATSVLSASALALAFVGTPSSLASHTSPPSGLPLKTGEELAPRASPSHAQLSGVGDAPKPCSNRKTRACRNATGAKRCVKTKINVGFIRRGEQARLPPSHACGLRIEDTLKAVDGRR
ncbi:hypothetical protein NHX12_002262 [Muraenolepis orangiensis]|uniref:Uncharacterized protein n=1 Tax=Muraenolepis orangiensis TaxID=630683 RepID=A0A9Q0DU33_9TELE|nr:hypothetical protein NHX12_002262 [Muraenolepis orangiensis]